MHFRKPYRLSRRQFGYVFVPGCIVALSYVFLSQSDGLSKSISVLRHADLSILALAGLSVVAMYVFAAINYQLLAPKKLRFRRTLAVQAATAFANRLLPAGLGSMTLNVEYIRRSGSSLEQSLAVVSTNNALGIIGHVFIMLAALLLGGRQVFGGWKLPQLPDSWVAIVAIVVVCAVVALVLKKMHRHLKDLVTGVSRYMAAYRKHPLHLVGAMLVSLGLTGLHVVTLYWCTQALGMDVSLWKIFIIFTAGVASGTATPIPGGLGGAEAGQIAGFVAYGIDPSVALAAVLLYRLCSFWLPLIPGFLAFLFVRKRYV